MEERYRSVGAASSLVMKVDGSKFIGDVIPVTREEEAQRTLETIRKKYFDATHHCFAFVLGDEGKIVRYSDDGEPSGTAGVKIHQAITSHQLSDLIVVVTRYFGGTKLGIGGLGRAYFECADSLLAASTPITKAVVRTVTVTFPFSDINPVMNLIHTHHLRIHSTRYTDTETVLTLQLLPSLVPSIAEQLVNNTRGAARIEIGELSTVVW